MILNGSIKLLVGRAFEEVTIKIAPDDIAGFEDSRVKALRFEDIWGDPYWGTNDAAFGSSRLEDGVGSAFPSRGDQMEVGDIVEEIERGPRKDVYGDVIAAMRFRADEGERHAPLSELGSEIESARACQEDVNFAAFLMENGDDFQKGIGSFLEFWPL